jgi:anti-sigma factor RsiW
MKQTKAICIEVEGLLPLFVGGDLEQEDATAVLQHIEECAVCAGALQRAETARRELRRGLAELVDGREPQLWPAIREELAREGLFREVAVRRSLVPGGERERLLFTRKSLRYAGGLAASLALIFLVGRNLDFGGADPVRPSAPDASGLAEVVQPTAPADLFADAGSAEPATRSAGGLRPVGLSETPLFDQARDAILRERAESQGIFFLPVRPTPSASEGELASSFSLQ